MAGQVAELEAYRSGARALAARILSAQEAERVRVSRELHDDTGQALTLILVRLQLIEGLSTDIAVRRELAEVRRLVVDAIDGVHRMTVQLGPSVLQDLGLRAGLEWLGDRVRGEGGITVDVTVDADDPVSSPTAVVVFRVAQEALTNVIRHSAATRVSLHLRQTRDELVLIVTDDGVGFDVADARSRPEQSVGLFGMAERVALLGGDLDIRSRPGSGTCIELRVPALEART
ncbi:MAG TPA: sensor histidine kinase [Candidatus Limnocylindria bacterium]|jgi:two-component system sensor histidine kinase UhpB